MENARDAAPRLSLSLSRGGIDVSRVGGAGSDSDRGGSEEEDEDDEDFERQARRVDRLRNGGLRRGAGSEDDKKSQFMLWLELMGKASEGDGGGEE